MEGGTSKWGGRASGIPAASGEGSPCRRPTLKRETVKWGEGGSSQEGKSPTHLAPKVKPLPRRSRTGIMNWLFGNFGKKLAEGPPSTDTGTEEHAAAIYSSPLRSATAIFHLKGLRGGRPAFERRRRRHISVAWKYKKSIGLFASFVFISNQILASGLLSMPSLVRTAGPSAAFVVILLFCLLASACALLLLKSMSLIEGNEAFGERYEYSAILRYFLTAQHPELPSHRGLSLHSHHEETEEDEEASEPPRKGPLDALDDVLYKATGLEHAGSLASDPESSGELEATKSPSLFTRIKRRLLSICESQHLPAFLRRTLDTNHSSLPQAIAFLLYINSFLSASSAALLVAYCIDAMLLRVLGWTVFIPILPYGADSWLGNVAQLWKNIGDLLSLTMWPLRYFIVGIWRLQGMLTATEGDAALYSSEALEDWVVSPQFKPFAFVFYPEQLEEIFSGVCTTACEAAATTAEVAACVPCLNYIGVSLGYLLTAAVGLRLAASDLEDTLNLQFVSFFAVVAAVLNVCATAFFRLPGRGWQGDLDSSADAVAAEAAATAAAAGGAAAGLPGEEALASVAGVTPGGGDWKEGLLPALQWVFGGFFARTAIPCMVDAFGFSSALPSWANEVQENVPVAKTVWMSSLFSAFFFFLFGCLCATSFVGAADSSNALASMLLSHSETPLPLAAAAFVCLFHIAALLPSIVLSQISSRYDLLNMAMCLDKKSAFRTASTVPWLLYWLLSYHPLFAQPCSFSALATGLIINFFIPVLTFIYASFFSDLLKKAQAENSASFGTGSHEFGEETASAAGSLGVHAALPPASLHSSTNLLTSLASRASGAKSLGNMGLNHHRGTAFAAASGAVAGGGAARTRELQRQLHLWLEEFARRAPDSDVAQLLQRNSESSESRGEADAAGRPYSQASFRRRMSKANSSGCLSATRLSNSGNLEGAEIVQPTSSMGASEGPVLLRGSSSPSLKRLSLSSTTDASAAAVGCLEAAEDTQAEVAARSMSPIPNAEEAAAAVEATLVDVAETLESAALTEAASPYGPSSPGTPPAQQQQQQQQDQQQKQQDQQQQQQQPGFEGSAGGERRVEYQRRRRRSCAMGRPRRASEGSFMAAGGPEETANPQVSPLNATGLTQRRASLPPNTMIDVATDAIALGQQTTTPQQRQQEQQKKQQKQQKQQQQQQQQQQQRVGEGILAPSASMHAVHFEDEAAAAAAGEGQKSPGPEASKEDSEAPQPQAEETLQRKKTQQQQKETVQRKETQQQQQQQQQKTPLEAEGTGNSQTEKTGGKQRDKSMGRSNSRCSSSTEIFSAASSSSTRRRRTGRASDDAMSAPGAAPPAAAAEMSAGSAKSTSSQAQGDAAAAAAAAAGSAAEAAMPAEAAACQYGAGLRRQSRSKAIRMGGTSSHFSHRRHSETDAAAGTPTGDIGEVFGSKGDAAAGAAAAAAAVEGLPEEHGFTRSRRRGSTVRRGAPSSPTMGLNAAETPKETSEPSTPTGKGTRGISFKLAEETAECQPSATTAAAAAAAAAAEGSKNPEETAETEQKEEKASKGMFSGWRLSGLRYVILGRVRFKGSCTKAKKESPPASSSGPRVVPFPVLRSPRAERLAAFFLLVVIALCAFLSVAEDLVDAVFLSFNFTRQFWSLSCASASQLAEWIAEYAHDFNTHHGRNVAG